MLAVNRLPDAVFSLLALGWVLKAHPRQWLRFLWPGILIGGLLVGYSLYLGALPVGPGLGWWVRSPGQFLAGLSGLLLSPGRGLLVYTPLVLFSLLGACLDLRRRRASAVHWLAIGIPCQVVLFALWAIWWGGWCFGPRFLTDALPLLILLLAPVWPWLRAKPVAKELLAVSIAVSFMVQLSGILWYPRGAWNSYPRSIDLDQARLWSWRDNPLLRMWREGLTVPRPLESFREELRAVSIASGRGRLLGLSIVARNLGNRPWPDVNDSRGRYAVQSSYLWWSEDAHQVVLCDSVPTPLPLSVAPGDSVVFDLPVIRPSDPGSYVLVIDMVQEGVGWFGDHGGQPLSLPVDVKSPSE